MMATLETLITDNLDTWVSAIKGKSTAGRGSGKKHELHGIKKLRELILNLATQGLLVTQDPEEKSAIKCLEASTRGVIEFLPHSDQAAPAGWVSLPLGCIIASNLGGGTPSKNNPRYWGGEIPWASVKDIQSEKFIDSTIDWITAAGLENSSSNLIPPNRLIVVTRMGLGKLAINRCAMAINQDLRAIEPVTALDLDFGYLLFKGLNLVGKGVTVQGVTVKELHTTRVLLPPLEEQHRIVAKVDELMALCDQLERKQEDSLRTHQNLVQTLLGALTVASERGQFNEAWKRFEANFDTLFTTKSSIDELKQTVLQLAVMGKLVPQSPIDEPAAELIKKIAAEKERLFKEKKLAKQKPLPQLRDDERPFPIPAGWSWARLEEVILQVTDGEHISPAKATSGVKLLTAKHIKAEGVTMADPQFVSENDAKKFLLRCKPEIGDIFICSRGTIGRSCVNEIDETFCLMGSVILLKKSDQVLSYYINYFIKSRIGQFFIQGVTKGMAVNALYLKDVKLCPVPLPPLAEQQRIVSKIDDLMSLCNKLQSRLESVQLIHCNLADSLVNKAIN